MNPEPTKYKMLADILDLIWKVRQKQLREARISRELVFSPGVPFHGPQTHMPTGAIPHAHDEVEDGL